MMTKRYLGNIITQNPTAPAGDLANSAAKGVWSLEEQLAYQKAGLWPVPGNFPLDVEDVFSTYLYDGTGAAQTITNGIDLDGEGGMVWTKRRDSQSGSGPWINDTERGITKYISTSDTGAETNSAGSISAVTSSGYTLGTFSGWNNSAGEYVSWTFRKAPKFFDVVTYTGNATARTISHNLGATVGTIIIKDLVFGNWRVFHRSVGNTKYLELNTTSAETTDANIWDNTDPTSSAFTIGSDGSVNENGRGYVAYLFAHNNGDGGFGADGDADIIKCGSYTGNGSTDGPEIDLGFEPQWLMFKNASATANWGMIDVMRGITNGGNDTVLFPDDNSDELGINTLEVTPNGFKVTNTTAFANTSGNTYIYIAIRRGTKVPESATEVFEVFETTNTGTASTIGSMGPSDFILNKRTDAAATWRAIDRLRGGSMLRTDSTDTETSASNYLEWDKMGGVFVTTQGAPFITNDSQAHWMWKRAPGYFDAVAYTGTGSAMTVSHNLGVAPEMMWVKSRSNTDDWAVYHSALGNTDNLFLNGANATASRIYWNNTTPTAIQFSLGDHSKVSNSGTNYIAYLFASLPGISKVGSYTGTGSTLNIDCGFTSGARFVMVKPTSESGNWTVVDTERGIIAGNDPLLFLNTTDAEDTTFDSFDPNSSGFTLTDDSPYANSNGATYIFYAIA